MEEKQFVWVLISEDGDGNWWGFNGVFKSTEMAIKFAKKFSDREDLEMVPAKAYDKEGKEFFPKDSFHIGYQNVRHFTVLYDLDKTEIN